MKSIGDTLKEARESKGLTIPQISLDLNISREYLIALEEEQFDNFPAETYLLGFLRNYSEYLGLDVDKNVTLYKNYRISEEPTPLEELVGQQKTVSAIPMRLILIILVLGLLGAGGWYAFQFFFNSVSSAETVAETPEPADFSLDLSSVEWQIHSGDRILVPYKDGELIMNVVLEDNRCRIEISDLPNEDILLFPGDEKTLPGGEGIPVVRMKLIALDGNGALLQVERTDIVAPEEEAGQVDDLIPASTSVGQEAEKILLSGLDEPENFTLNAQFNSYSLFRYKADGGNDVEKYYRDGDRFRLDVDRVLMIWASSAGSVSLSVSGVTIAPGKSGEVLVKLIQWVKNDDGKYDLVLFPVQ
jgi:cytoskeletal protein RodZ